MFCISIIQVPLKATIRKRVGQDVADEGKDTSALCFSHGSVVIDLEEWRKGDTDFTATKAYHYARDNGAAARTRIGSGALPPHECRGTRWSASGRDARWR